MFKGDEESSWYLEGNEVLCSLFFSLFVVVFSG